MSVPAYNDVLTRLFASVAQAVERTEYELVNKHPAAEDYRKTVIRHLVEITDQYLRELPDQAEHGAIVTLKGYGTRNRNDIVRRIESGLYPKVEQAYRARTS
ncbi:MAG: hypothetical protein HY619_02520 [Thaumarchaeota archaeon]|nr:hypothetical protein [Nitrososphaerota archaeon]